MDRSCLLVETVRDARIYTDVNQLNYVFLKKTGVGELNTWINVTLELWKR